MFDASARGSNALCGSAIQLHARGAGGLRSVTWQIGLAFALAAAGAGALTYSQYVRQLDLDPPQPVVAVQPPPPPPQPSQKAADILPAGPLQAAPPIVIASAPIEPAQPEPSAPPLMAEAEPALEIIEPPQRAEPAANRAAVFAEALSRYTFSGVQDGAPDRDAAPRPAGEAFLLPPPRIAAFAAPADVAPDEAPPAPEVAGGLDPKRVVASRDTPTACLPSEILSALQDTAARFGPLVLISTTALRSDNHAAGSGRARMHQACQAADFRPPQGQLQAILAFLRARRDLGGVEGFRNNVIHIDGKQHSQAIARRAPPRRKAAPVLEEGDTSADQVTVPGR